MALSAKGEALKNKNKSNRAAAGYSTNDPVNASNIEPGGFNSSTPEDKPKVDTPSGTFSASVNNEQVNIGGEKPKVDTPSPTIYTANFEGVKPNTTVTGVATGTIDTTKPSDVEGPGAAALGMTQPTPTETTKTEPTTPVSTPSGTTTPTATGTTKTEQKNEALDFNKLVEANRKKGMSEEDAFKAAMQFQKTGVDFDSSKGREAEINANLEKFYTGGATDLETLKKMSGFETADAGKKALIIAFWNSKQPKDEGQFFNMLRTGALITEEMKKSPQYTSAKARFDKFNTYSSYTVPQLVDALKTTLLPGTPEYNDLMNDPASKAKLLEANKFVNKAPDITTYGETKTNEILSSNPTTSNALSDGVITEDEYKQMLSTPEINSKTADVEAKLNKYNELNGQYEDIETNTKEEFKGKMSDTAIQSIIADRQKGIYRSLQNARNEYNTALGTLTTMKESQAKIVEMNFDLYRENLAYGRTLSAEERAFERQKELAQLQQGFQSEQNKVNFEQQKEIARIQNEYRLADISTSIIKDEATGKQQLINSKTGEVLKTFDTGLSKKTEGAYGFQNIGGGIIAVTNPVTGVVEFKSSTGTTGATGSSWISSIGDGKPTFYGGRIEGDVGLDIAGAEGFDVTSPVTGTILTSGTSDLYGKYVEIKTEDGSRIRLSHLDPAYSFTDGNKVFAGDFLAKQKNTGTVMAQPGRGVLDITTWDASGKPRTARETEQFLTGGTLAKTGQVTTFKTDAIPSYENYLRTGKIGTNATEIEGIIKEFGSEENFRKQAEAYNNSPNGPRIQELEKLEKLRDKFSEVISDTNSEALSNSVGSVQFTAWPTTARAKKNFLADVQNLLEGQTLQKLIDAKGEGATFGALSNEELRMLQNSASVLNQLALREDEDNPTKITGFSGDEEVFKQKVQEVIAGYNKMIDRKKTQMGITTSTMSTSSPMSTVNTSYYGNYKDKLNKLRGKQ